MSDRVQLPSVEIGVSFNGWTYRISKPVATGGPISVSGQIQRKVFTCSLLLRNVYNPVQYVFRVIQLKILSDKKKSCYYTIQKKEKTFHCVFRKFEFSTFHDGFVTWYARERDSHDARCNGKGEKENSTDVYLRIRATIFLSRKNDFQQNELLASLSQKTRNGRREYDTRLSTIMFYSCSSNVR